MRDCRFPGDDIPIVRGSALLALKGERDEIGRCAACLGSLMIPAGWEHNCELTPGGVFAGMLC